MPVLAFLVILDAYLDVHVGTKPDYVPVSRLIKGLLAIVGFGVLVYACAGAFNDYQNLKSVETLRIIALAPLLSIAFIPFIYAMVLYSTYESVFTRIKFGHERSNDVERYARLKILMHHGLNLKRLREFHRQRAWDVTRIQTRDDVDNLFVNSSDHN